MHFSKYHALGNDYLVIRPEEIKVGLTPELIRSICHRNYGIGSDGILLGPLPSESCLCGLKIYNPDGSEAESGRLRAELDAARGQIRELEARMSSCSEREEELSARIICSSPVRVCHELFLFVRLTIVEQYSIDFPRLRLDT